MSERMALLECYVGTNGSGKTFQMKKNLPMNARNLILPSSRADKEWHGIKELKPVLKFRLDERDPRGQRRIPYYTIPDLATFRGNRVLHVEGQYAAEIFDAVIDPRTGFRDGALFMDDFKNYIPSQALLPGNVRTMFGNRRHRMLDIFMAAWTFQDINAEIIGFQPQWFVFNVTRPPSKAVEEKVDDFPGLLATYHRVRQHNAALPAGRKWHFEPFPPLT